MITTKTKNIYFEWLTAEEMHHASKKWLSELHFIKDEHIFFEHLITEQTSQLIAYKDFNDTQEIVEVINRSQKKNNELIRDIELHERELEIMIDGVNDIKKEALYKKLHRQLLSNVSDYLYAYKKLKMQLFTLVKHAMKKDKQNRLLDKK